MARVLSGIEPSGTPHLGNYLGALRQWADEQWENDALYCVVDLHALTLDIEPDKLRVATFAAAVGILAAGVDPARSIVFVQSHVPQHNELQWLLECTASYGELQRMTQFKEKSVGQESVRASLLTYPVLMAADILLYDTDRVPVGDDQRQHLELARDLAIRFNFRYGDTFVVPEAAIPKVGARVMDLQEPQRKMSKSVSSPLGLVEITDTPEAITRKVRRAVTDTEAGVVYDRERRPGVANLLEILAVVTGDGPDLLAGRYETYGPLKADVAEGLVELLRPVRKRFSAYTADPAEMARILAAGAERARALATPTLARARAAMGLLPPG